MIKKETESLRALALNISPEAISQMIDKLSRGVPPSKYLREFVKNGYDALQRGGATAEDNATISIARDAQYPNKIVIANSRPGAPITEDIALNSLNALGSPANGHEYNHGVGAKISYLPQHKMGILFRCRQDNMYFILYKDEYNNYGLKTEMIDGEYVQLFHCSDEGFTFPDSEVEVVLLGDTEEQDTWLETLKVVNPRQDSNHSRYAGWNIRDYFNKSFWVSPDENVKLRIGIYNEEGERQSWASPKYLKSIKESFTTKDGGCNGTVEHPDGTKIHYFALKFEKGKKIGTHHNASAGQISYIHNDEVITIPTVDENTRSSRMRSAGIVTHNKHVGIIVDYTDSRDSNFSATLDRSTVVDDNGMRADDIALKYTEYFSHNLPSDLREWMSNLLVRVETDIVKEMGKYFQRSQFKLPRENRSSSDEDSETAEDTNNDNKKPRKPRKKGSSSNRGKGYGPTLIVTEEGEDANLVAFASSQYQISINSTHPLFLSKLQSLVEDSHSKSISKSCLIDCLYRGFAFYYLDIKKVYSNESEQQLSVRLSSDKLDTLIANDTKWLTKRIKSQVEKQNKENILTNDDESVMLTGT
jgi:hypothetical protein